MKITSYHFGDTCGECPPKTLLLLMPIQKNLDIFEGGQSFVDQPFDFLAKIIDLVGDVDEFNHNRQVFGEAQNFCGMNSTGGAEPFDAAQHGASGKALCFGKMNNELI